MIPSGEVAQQEFNQLDPAIQTAIAAKLAVHPQVTPAVTATLDPAVQAAMQAHAAPQPYVTPTARANGFMASGYAQKLGQRGIDPAQVLRTQAAAYARQRLAQFRQVAPFLDQDFQAALHNTSMADPEAAYRALSQKFSTYSKANGVADPRQLLRSLLAAGRRPS